MCASCPFRKDNDEAFGEVIQKLRTSRGDLSPVTPFDIACVRESIRRERRYGGDFLCHATVYDKEMQADTSSGLQCPGASEYYRNGGPSDGD